MRHLATAPAVLIGTLLLVACGAGDAADPGQGGVNTDPLTQATQEWTVDRPTEAWFEGLCTVLATLEPPFDEPADQVASRLTETGDTLLTTSSALGAMPVPTFTGGSGYATAAVSDLAEIGRTYHSAADQWDDAPDTARLAVDQVLADRAPDLDGVDPDVADQLRNLPACQSVRSTF